MLNIPLAAAVRTTSQATKGRRPGASRTSKRKAPALAMEPGGAPDSDSDQMEMDQAKIEEQDGDEAPEPMTPEQSDAETDDQVDAAPPNRGPSSETLRSSSGVAQGSKGEAIESKGVPPPRALPFANRMLTRRGKVAEPQPRPIAAESDNDNDETEDEEL